MSKIYEILLGVFHNYPQDTFENDREKIHSAFYKLRESHQELLGGITFKTHSVFPRSKLLDELLSSLQPGFLFKVDGFSVYQLNKENLKRAWDKLLPVDLKKREKELRDIANGFKSYME